MSVENKTDRDLFVEHSTGHFRQRLEAAGRTIGQLAVARGEIDYEVIRTAPHEEWLQTIQKRGIADADAFGKIIDYAFAKAALNASRDTAALIYDRDYISTGTSWQPAESEGEK